MDIGERIQQDIQQYEVKKKEILRAKEAGISLPKNPPEIAEANKIFPTDITLVDLQELGRLHSTFTALYCYANTLVTLSDMDMTIAEEILNFVKTKVMLLKSDDEEQKVTFSKAKATVSKYVRIYQTRYLQAHIRYKLVSGMLQNYDKYLICISREITRREHEIDRTVRENNL